ncbi:MAG: V-type ATP synthase subunit E [Candidatus Margulisbacteria bacterium]|nr:V-type ATP synthase subunit E [Candidatus Margulisiibacteriota bacterium]
MALRDIEKKIVQEAEKEAKKIIADAEKENKAKLNSVKNELKQEQDRLKESIQKKIIQAVEQRKMLAKLEATQKILFTKRKYLEQMFTEVKEDILNSEEYSKTFFREILKKVKKILPLDQAITLEVAAEHEEILLKAIKAEELVGKIVPHKGWAKGSMEIISGKSRIDCSLDISLAEELKAQEKKLAEMLF